MELENVNIPATNRFASLYIEQKQPVKDFFHYDITEATIFQKRYEDLQNRNFEREKLVSSIERFMGKFPSSNEIKKSLNKLLMPDSAVVIGGQQAGLLTGPMYAIHKIISIIKLAREQELELKKPVVPVFWIAGEDHDYLEVNHVFVEWERALKKISYSEGPIEKKMVSDIIFDKKHMKKWIDKVFEYFGETKFTKDIMNSIEISIERSETFVDFFTHIIMDLFKDYGLLVIDSADAKLREIEKPFFKQIIEKHESITHSVLSDQETIIGYEFSKAIDISKHALNLFYYDGTERILLEFSSERNGFIGKSGKTFFTKEELLSLLEKTPQCFSNNVVTRPLMQEWLFPTLAFIAGPGEIAYWGELKTSFENLGFNMPPIIPRLNISLLDRSVESDIQELQLSAKHILRSGIGLEKSNYWNSVKNEGLDSIIIDTKGYLESQYQQILKGTDRGLIPIVEKNLSYHLNQLEFLQRKIDQTIQQKHDVMLEKYDRIERSLRPGGAPQERIWNIYYFLNKYGQNFIDELMNINYQFDGTHKLIKI